MEIQAGVAPEKLTVVIQFYLDDLYAISTDITRVLSKDFDNLPKPAKPSTKKKLPKSSAELPMELSSKSDPQLG